MDGNLHEESKSYVHHAKALYFMFFNATLRGLIFAGIIFRKVREFFRKFAKINPRENFKNLLIREI